MRTIAWTAWEARRRPRDLIAAALAAGYVLMVMRTALGSATFYEFLLVFLPPLLFPLLFLHRVPLSRVQVLAAGACAVGSGAMVGGTFVLSSQPIVVLAVPAIALAAVACAARPAAGLTIALACTGFFGSLTAFTPVPAAKLADLALIGLWLSTLWTLWLRRNAGGALRPALLALAAYIVLSAFMIFTSGGSVGAFQSWRGSTWYMGVVLLIAFSPWTVDTRRRMVRGAIVVGAAVGGYATLRWAIGPAGAEEELAAAIPNNFLDGDLRPVGSFVTTKELSAWTATMMPFALTFAFTERGHWRLMALAAFCLCAMGMLASDVRAGPAAAAPAVVVVVLLYQCSQAYRGRRGPTAMIVVLIMACAGAGAFTITLADKRDTKNRYENILHPERDESYQARLVKWRAALDDIDEVPFGYGLGTAGRSQERYGTTNNIGSYNLDNSYLKVAYEQGFVVMVLLVAIFLGLFAMLATGAVSLSDPARAGPAIAAAGTLVTMLALFYIGLYIEGLPALAGWILVGLGAGQLTRPA